MQLPKKGRTEEEAVPTAFGSCLPVLPASKHAQLSACFAFLTIGENALYCG